MSNVFASAIFCVRNKDKVEQGDIGRLPVAIGQAKNVINSIYTVDNAIGRTAKTASEAFHIAAKKEKLLDVAGKGVNFLSKNVNGIIIVTSGINVLIAEDKPKAFVENGLAVGGMFAGEALMKKHLDKGFSAVSKIKGIDKVAQGIKCVSKTTKWGGIIPSLIKGVTFVAGSITSYNLGQKLGKELADKIPPSGKKSEMAA